MISSTGFSNAIDQYRNENNYNHSREYSWNHCYNYYCEVTKRFNLQLNQVFYPAMKRTA